MTDAAKNKPLVYDDHGVLPLDLPFDKLAPENITFYLDLNTRVGKNTCRQTCEHCFFIRLDAARNRTMDLVEGRELMKQLRAQGYKVFANIADTFGLDGEFMRIFSDRGGATPVHDYRTGLDRVPTKSMEKGEIWTSGAHLLGDDWQELLVMAVEHDYGTVTITFHGVPDENLVLRPRETYPIRGVFLGQDTETVIRRVHQFNEAMLAGKVARRGMRPGEQVEPLRINLGVTIGAHNHGREMLVRYVRYFDALGVNQVRFNRFAVHNGRLPELALGEEQVREFYRDLKWVHENVPLELQLAVSEDFGTAGIEVMGFPEHTGWCRAGHQFFTIVGDRVTLLDETDTVTRERIGTISGCAELHDPGMGQVVRVTDKYNSDITYHVEFWPDAIASLQRMRADGSIRDGCWAPEFQADQRRKEAGEVRPAKLSVLRSEP